MKCLNRGVRVDSYVSSRWFYTSVVFTTPTNVFRWKSPVSTVARSSKTPKKTHPSRSSPAVKNAFTTNFASRCRFSRHRLRPQSPCFECYCLLLILSPIKSRTRVVTVARACGLTADAQITGFIRERATMTTLPFH